MSFIAPVSRERLPGDASSAATLFDLGDDLRHLAMQVGAGNRLTHFLPVRLFVRSQHHTGRGVSSTDECGRHRRCESGSRRVAATLWPRPSRRVSREEAIHPEARLEGVLLHQAGREHGLDRWFDRPTHAPVVAEPIGPRALFWGMPAVPSDRRHSVGIPCLAATSMSLAEPSGSGGRPSDPGRPRS